jgi:hypothetical protein
MIGAGSTAEVSSRAKQSTSQFVRAFVVRRISGVRADLRPGSKLYREAKMVVEYIRYSIDGPFVDDREEMRHYQVTLSSLRSGS